MKFIQKIVLICIFFIIMPCTIYAEKSSCSYINSKGITINTIITNDETVKNSYFTYISYENCLIMNTYKTSSVCGINETMLGSCFDDNYNNAFDYYSQTKSCPPYFFLYYNTNDIDNPYMGIYTDNLENSMAKIANKSDLLFTFALNEEKNEKGDVVVSGKVSNFSFRANILNEEYITNITIDYTNKILTSNKGYIIDESNFYSTNNLEAIYVCKNTENEYNQSSYISATREDLNKYFGFEWNADSDTYDGNNYKCAIGTKFDNNTELGTSSCKIFTDYFAAYKKANEDKNIMRARNNLNNLKQFCSSIFQNDNFNTNNEFSCLNLCLNLNESLPKNSKIEINDCYLSDNLTDFIENIVKWIRYLVPVIVIVLGIIDFIKAISSEKDEEIKKAQGKFIKRLIAAALVFLIPLIIAFILDKFGFVAEGCGIIDL